MQFYSKVVATVAKIEKKLFKVTYIFEKLILTIKEYLNKVEICSYP